MDQIKHIVYLMFENRSLDNLLGWLYENEEPKLKINIIDPPYYDGLKEDTFYNYGRFGWFGIFGKKHFITRGTGHKMNVPSFDPDEEYSCVNTQLFEDKSNPGKGKKPTMGGFYKDCHKLLDWHRNYMETFTPENLPVINELARNFAVSDRYFSSVPTQTNCNRAFAACGNSLGINDDGQLEAFVNNRATNLRTMAQPKGRQFNQRTFYNVLSENGVEDWKVYHSMGTDLENKLGVEGYAYTRCLMEELQGSEFDDNFDQIESFIEDAKCNNLPRVSFLEPEWGLKAWILGINGNDYHPPCNVSEGEKFLKEIYDALKENEEVWNSTLFIINFDEHGGTYDHVPPPWTAAQPWGGESPIPVPDKCELGFQFDRFGVRVPLILVSPYIEESTVFRAEGDIPYDHASVIATILKMMGIDKKKWELGNRVDKAPTFENVLTRSTPRNDKPDLNHNHNEIIDETMSDPSPNHIQQTLMHNVLHLKMKKDQHNDDKVIPLYKEHFSDITKVSHLMEATALTFKKLVDKD